MSRRDLLRVAVLTGGRSCERDVSIASHQSVVEALRESGHIPVPVEVDREGVWHHAGAVVSLAPGRGVPGIDVVFPMLIGTHGEDGTIQGLLECLRVPYVGAGVLGSAVCFDKLMFKTVMAHAEIPQTAYRAVRREELQSGMESVRARVEPLGLPLFVKPTASGSSYGVSRVEGYGDLAQALELAFAFGAAAIVEAAAGGCEVECSVIGNQNPFVSTPGEVAVVRSGAGWRDQKTKATPGSIELHLPARTSERALEQVRDLSVRAFAATGCSGMARVDFFVDGEEVLINEVNTMPGMMKVSVFPLMLAHSGVPYPEMIDRLVQLALERDAGPPGSGSEPPRPVDGAGELSQAGSW